MQTIGQPSGATLLGRGMLAGLAGTVVMTAFQKLIEMPITRRPESYTPADFAEKVLAVHPTTREGRRRRNNVTHLALGGMWGAAYGVAAAAGLRGPKVVNAVFGVVYTGDMLGSTRTTTQPDPSQHRVCGEAVRRAGRIGAGTNDAAESA